MWIPESEQDILTATINSSLEETVTFDAKKELPPKNSEIAKDVSAMANTAGGVIIFGIDEDVSGRPTIPTPFELKGQREKIDNVLRTLVSEVPNYTISAIESQSNAAKGYIVLVIPPSERAPHMVIKKGELRYYGRGETGNYILSESEVARLYERRNLATSDLSPVIEKQIENAPITDHRGFIHLHLVIKPVLHDDSTFEKAVKGFSLDYGSQVDSQILLNLLIEKVREPSVYLADRYYNFPTPPRWIHQPKGFLGKLSSAYRNDESPNADTLHLEVGFDGSGNLFCGGVGKTIQKQGQGDRKIFYPDAALPIIIRFIVYFGYLYKYASYFGKVDIGIALTGLKDCQGYVKDLFHLPLDYHHTEETYSRILRFPAKLLVENPQEVAADLIMRFIDTMYQGRFNPFNKN